VLLGFARGCSVLYGNQSPSWGRTLAIPLWASKSLEVLLGHVHCWRSGQDKTKWFDRKDRVVEQPACSGNPGAHVLHEQANCLGNPGARILPEEGACLGPEVPVCCMSTLFV
jgi:hypothetical protein